VNVPDIYRKIADRKDFISTGLAHVAPVLPRVRVEVPTGVTSADPAADVDTQPLVAVLARLAPAMAVVLGVIQSLFVRLPFSSDDAVSYLDVADAYRQHHWRAALNGYWSPLYSWILAAAGSIVRPSPLGEMVMLRVVNLVLFLMALAVFGHFLRRLRDQDQVHRTARGGMGDTAWRIPSAVWAIMGYAAFTYASLQWIGVGSDTPDMLTAALVFLSGSIVVSARRGERPYAHQAALGVVGGLAYLS